MHGGRRTTAVALLRLAVATAFPLSLALQWTSRGPAASLNGWELVGFVGSGALAAVVPTWTAVLLAAAPAAGLLALAACVTPGRVADLVTGVALATAAVTGAAAAAVVLVAPQLHVGAATVLVGAAALAVLPVLVLSRRRTLEPVR